MPKKKSPNSVRIRIRNRIAEFLTFAYQTGGDGVEVRVQNGTIWLHGAQPGNALPDFNQRQPPPTGIGSARRRCARVFV